MDMYKILAEGQSHGKPLPKVGEVWLKKSWRGQPEGKLFTVTEVNLHGIKGWGKEWARGGYLQRNVRFHVWKLDMDTVWLGVGLGWVNEEMKKADQQGLPKSQRAKVAPKPGEVWQMLGNIGPESDRVYTILSEAPPEIRERKEGYVNTGEMVYLETLDPKRGMRSTGMELDFFYRYMLKI